MKRRKKIHLKIFKDYIQKVNIISPASSQFGGGGGLIKRYHNIHDILEKCILTIYHDIDIISLILGSILPSTNRSLVIQKKELLITMIM